MVVPRATKVAAVVSKIIGFQAAEDRKALIQEDTRVRDNLKIKIVGRAWTG